MSGESAERFITRKQAVQLLRDRGLPVSMWSLAKLDQRRVGPPRVIFLGRTLYRPGDVLGWADSRLVAAAA